jgi:hypothetical protein
MIKVTEQIGGASFMTPKGQAGIPEEQQGWFNKTSLNPVILDAGGTLFSYAFMPWLAQVPPSSTALRGIWGGGLNKSAVLGSNATRVKEILALCDAGAAGDEDKAVACIHLWQFTLIPEHLKKVDIVRDILDVALPNVDAAGKPFSGSYWSETDYHERDFQLAYWGAEKYQKLLAIKQAYDPDGLFICHHCVGSEFWTAESKLMCRNESMVV